MIRYLLDTNHAGLLFREPDTSVWVHIAQLSRKQCGLCWPSIGELKFMVENSAQKETNRRKLLSLIPQFSIWRYEHDEAREFGRLRVELRAQGTPIPMVDVMIAATARANNLVVVTADQHFNLITGLKVENWM